MGETIFVVAVVVLLGVSVFAIVKWNLWECRQDSKLDIHTLFGDDKDKPGDSN